MYDWADEWILKDANTVQAKGIPVIVYGEYNFEGKSPWLALVSNPKANDISQKELESLVDKYLSEILQEQENRVKVLAQQ